MGVGLWLVVASLFAACSLDQNPGSGGLAVVVDSDMAVPKDIDQITVDVSQLGKSIQHEDQPFIEGRAALPFEVRISRTDDRSPALIRVVASKEGRARVVREAITTIPTTYLGLLRMPVDYLCDGLVTDAGDSSCGTDQTCMQGTCAPATLAMDPPPYGALDMTTLEAVRSADAGISSCFSISTCFAEATEITPDPTRCTFTPPSLFGDHMNVALRLDLGSPGVCDDSACWVVLDSGTEGWKIVNGQVVLPTSICQRRNQGTNLRVAVTQLCDPKTELTPSCNGAGPGITVPGHNPPVTNVTTAQGVLPAVGDACTGPGARACGLCGTTDRMCQNGLWSTYGDCTNQGGCQPNQLEMCGSSGSRACGGDCTWGSCQSQRCDGASTRSCGNCGTQHRACDNGVWGDWSACEAEGECIPNTTQTCGVAGTQACGGSCTWGPCGMQLCPGAPSQACGNCGMQMRTCDGGTANWSPYGPCQGEGVCAPNATQTCGMNGTQTCGGMCQWDLACTGQTCPGAAEEACGNCGTRARTCDMNTGLWSAWSDCQGQGQCAPDMTRTCGANGTGTQSCAGNCQWDDACTGQLCVGDSVQGCGALCGMSVRTCDTNTGTWSDFSACLNEGECSPGAMQTCGTGGMRTCNDSCRWPGCPRKEPKCGDGHVDRGETCDGDCPTSCDDSNDCTSDTKSGSASTCDVKCTHAAITMCKGGDRCCPSSCNNGNDSDCTPRGPVCGNGVVEAPETCDGNCPTSCDDKNACTTDTLSGSASTCDVKCTHAAITMCKGGDRCCPSSCNNGNDSDCTPPGPVCGNGVVEAPETCDGNCPTSCDDNNDCTSDTKSGGAATCDVKCAHAAITMCKGGDGCCPSSCNNGNDSDCAPTGPVCGNGVVEAPETCDGNCPTSCDDKNACTTDTLNGSAATCDVKCAHASITMCKGGDGCCPSSCNNGNDSDCAPTGPVCGNGVVEAPETCDGNCPTSCDDKNACTTDTLNGSAATCDVKCAHAAITMCKGGDGCCPSSCNNGNDSDCAPTGPVCGNGVVEAPETCDGNCPTSCDDKSACTTDTLSGSAATCDVKCAHASITMCKGGDGCCPSSCNNGNDSDCAPTGPVCGNGVVEAPETCDGNCPTSCDHKNACTTDTLSGSATNCTAKCTNTPITTCTAGDGCCPTGCTNATDADCKSPGGERTDPDGGTKP